MIETLSGLQIEPDGTIVGITPPRGDALIAWLRREFGGWPEYAHYGTTAHAVCVVVHETSMDDRLPVNTLVTKLVEKLIDGPLGYQLHGRVYLFGYERPGVTSDLREETRAIVESLAGAAR
jgi:hypothetical protein